MLRHLAGVYEVVDDLDAAVSFYEGLGTEIRRLGPEYAIVEMPGVLHFSLSTRPLWAEATFGDRSRADEIALGFAIGIEVDDAAGATELLGDRVVLPATAQHDQVTTRFRSPSGTLCEAAETPHARRLVAAPRAEP